MSTSPRPSVLLIRGTSDTFLGKSSPASRRIGGMAMDLVKAFCNWAVVSTWDISTNNVCLSLSYLVVCEDAGISSIEIGALQDRYETFYELEAFVDSPCCVWSLNDFGSAGSFRKIIARGMVSIMAISQAKPGGCYLLPKKQPHHGSCRSTAIGLLAQWASWHCPSWVSILCCLAWKGLSRLCTKVA